MALVCVEVLSRDKNISRLPIRQVPNIVSMQFH